MIENCYLLQHVKLYRQWVGYQLQKDFAVKADTHMSTNFRAHWYTYNSSFDTKYLCFHSSHPIDNSYFIQNNREYAAKISLHTTCRMFYFLVPLLSFQPGLSTMIYDPLIMIKTTIFEPMLSDSEAIYQQIANLLCSILSDRINLKDAVNRACTHITPGHQVCQLN